MKRLALVFVCAAALLPALMAADDTAKPQADADGFYPLFNGKDLSGWHINESPETFKVEDGVMVVNGNRSHAFYEGSVANHQFQDFHFKAEIMTMPKSNSGVYFHTKFQPDGWPKVGFEAQVNNTHGDRKKTGGLYSVKDVMDNPPAKDNEWFVYEIIVKGKDVKILVDGKPTTEWTQPADWNGTKEYPERKLDGGTFAIQGHDPVSKVLYKSIKVKPL